MSLFDYIFKVFFSPWKPYSRFAEVGRLCHFIKKELPPRLSKLNALYSALSDEDDPLHVDEESPRGGKLHNLKIAQISIDSLGNSKTVFQT